MNIEAHIATVTGVMYSPDGSTLATASKDKMAKFWRLGNSQLELIASVNIGLQGIENQLLS